MESWSRFGYVTRVTRSALSYSQANVRAEPKSGTLCVAWAFRPRASYVQLLATIVASSRQTGPVTPVTKPEPVASVHEMPAPERAQIPNLPSPLMSGYWMVA
jgi:hypothetical protein